MLWGHRRRYALLAALAVTAGTGTYTAQAATAATSSGAATATAPSACRLDQANGAIKHVIYLQFDNVHLTRDNPNVPSDLEQMPNLKNFITSGGVMDADHHTPLIAHTGNDILTSLTGVYGDRHGQPVANSYRYFTPSGVSNTGVTFAYWTDGVFDPSTSTPTDTAPTMVDENGKVAPAPWVPFTRAGCDVGSAAAANTILENTGPDVPKVFGANSPEAAEAKANPSLASTDFVGIGVHCAQDSKLCAAGNGKADLLPDEPGSYNGYDGLFGAKYVDPVISPNGPVTAVDGSTPITDSQGRAGFPGFDSMSAANTLGYVAQMQEAGVPVTYGYISDAHDDHVNGVAFGPGQAGYVAALKSYDNAFGTFFTRLAKDGIDKSNTLFVVTSDENDHFVGGPPSPANCDGVHTPCTYQTIGEVNANVRGLLATQENNTTPFGLHSDSAPNFYVNGNPAASTDPVRGLEKAVAGITTTNPLNGQSQHFATYFADPVEQKLLHMVTSDPLRTPTFTVFANPDYFVYAGAANCNSACVDVEPGFAWNHGDFSPDINTTWLGIAGPGIKNLGTTKAVWSDHTDIRPTILTLLGLHDDYVSDGAPLVGFIKPSALPRGLRGHDERLERLIAQYKQLNASVGVFGSNTLKASTAAILSTSTGDATYQRIEADLSKLGDNRDQLAGVIKAYLGALSNGYVQDSPFVDSILTGAADRLLDASAHVS